MEFKILVGMVIIIRLCSGSSAVAYAQGTGMMVHTIVP